MSNSNGGWDFSEYSSPSSGSGSNAGASSFGGFGGQPQPGAGHPGRGQGFGAPQQPGFGSPFNQPAGGAANPFGTGAGAPGADLFGSANSLGGASARLEAVAAPTGWLFAAVGLALVSGIVASIFGGNPVIAIVCWALAGPVTIGLFAMYLLRDVKGRAHLMYSPPTWAPKLYAAGLVITFAAVMIASLQIAFWVGRL